LPHASVVLSYAEDIQFTSNETARLLNEVGVYLRNRAEYKQAKRIHERALAIDEAILGPDHPDVAIDASNLGSVLKDQGNLSGAKPLIERALRIFREFLGDAHPNTKTAQNNLRLLEEEIKNAQP
jgi:tetratricopeptide (TPR) repeat protein